MRGRQGDLNYRIDLPDAKVRALLAGAEDAAIRPPVRAENLALLQRFDQVRRPSCLSFGRRAADDGCAAEGLDARREGVRGLCGA